MGSLEKTMTELNQENPVPAEVIAQAIVDVARGMEKVNQSRLSREALVTLIAARSRVSRANIELVLNNLDALERIWLKPKAVKKK